MLPFPSSGAAGAPALAAQGLRADGGEGYALLALLWRQGRGTLCWLAACSLGLGGVLLAATWIGRALFEALALQADARSFALLLAAAAGLIMAQSALGIVQAVSIGALTHRLTAALQEETLDELLRYRYPFFVARRSAEIGHGLEDDCCVMADRAAKVAAGLADLLQLALWMAFFLRVIPWMDALVLGVVVLVVAWGAAWRRAIARSDAAVGHDYTALWHVVVQAVLGVRVVKLDLLKAELGKVLAAAASRLHAEHRRNYLANATIWELFSVVPWVLLGAALSLSVDGLRREALTLAEAILAILFLERLMGPLVTATAGFLAVPGFQAARQSLARLRIGDFEREGKRGLVHAPRSIALREVRFTHPGTRSEVPGGTLEIAGGLHTAIVGQTGCGKSTLLALCTRLLEPEGGEVLLDGVELGQFTLRSLRRSVVVANQDARIFRGTLRSNLDVRATLPDHVLLELLEQAGLGDLASQGRGLDTPLSYGGPELSGGELRRITVLRALALSPKVLLLDEPTAALDAATARRLCELLYRGGAPTTLTVTHSKLVLEYMDRVYRVAAGRIEEVAR